MRTFLTNYISGFVYITSGLKYPKLVLDGHMFTVANKGEGKTSWVCRNYNHTKGTKCKGRIITYGKVVCLVREHNHPPIVPDEELEKMHRQAVLIKRS